MAGDASGHTLRWPRSLEMRKGWGRLEIFVTIGIVLVGLSLLLIVVSRSRTSSRARACEERLMEIGMTTIFRASLSGEYVGFVQPHSEVQGARNVSWPVMLLPYLGRPKDLKTGMLPGKDVLGPRAHLFDRFGKPLPAADSAEAAVPFLPEFVCPEDPRLRDAKKAMQMAALSYVLNCGLPDAAEEKQGETFYPDWPSNGIGMDRVHTRGKLKENGPEGVEAADGAAFTFLFSESTDATQWTDASEAGSGFMWSTFLGEEGKADEKFPLPQVLRINQQRGVSAAGRSEGSILHARPASYHTEPGKSQPIHGVYVLYCDGHIKFLNEQLEQRIYLAMTTPQGEEAKMPGSGVLLDAPWREDHPEETQEPLENEK